MSACKLKSSTIFFILSIIGLILTTYLVYVDVQLYDFFIFDDPDYVVFNEQVHKGLTSDTIQWAFTHFHAGNWHPLIWISLMLDMELHGLNAGKFHQTNLLLHLLNTALLLSLLLSITSKPWPSLLVTALFALHPIHVESVAWITERKDVLSMFFFLLCLHSYVLYVRTEKIIFYSLTIFSFALGLMSKQMLVTTPILLILLDFWPLQRWNTLKEFIKSRHIYLEKIPLLLMALATGLLTIMAAESANALSNNAQLSLDERLFHASVSYLYYIYHLFYPVHLGFFYPHPYIYGNGYATWQIICSVLILGVITIIAIARRNSQPYLFTGWFWYLVTLLPVIGLIQAGQQAMADRFAYIPFIGLYLILAFWVNQLIMRWRSFMFVIIALTCSTLSLLSYLSHTQVSYWENSKTMLEHTLNIQDNNPVAHNLYGTLLKDEGNFINAERHFLAALEIAPGHILARINLANLYMQQHETNLASQQYEKILKLEPDNTNIRLRLANLYLHQSQCVSAALHYETLLGQHPDDAGTLNSYAWLLTNCNNGIIPDHQKALRLAISACELTNYTNPEYLDTLASVYIAVNKRDVAISYATRAFELFINKNNDKRAKQVLLMYPEIHHKKH